jgi:drug/metabolite transporter (DMT)-like permease
VLATGLSVLAAALNAAASVLQRRAARDEPDDREFSLRLLLDLVRRPIWLAGIAAIIAGFATQAVALALGGVAVVQPLLIAELPFTILLAGLVFRTRPGPREWWSIAALAVGLAAVVFALAPQGGDPLAVPGAVWAIGSAATAVLFAVALVAGLRTHGPRRAAAFGIGTGILFGFVAVLVAAVGTLWGHGLPAVLTAWQTWAVVVIGPLSFFMLQNALQAGDLVASQPGMTLANPLIATTWGVVVFDEQVRRGGWLALTAAGGLLLVAGTIALARSPLLRDEEPAEGRGDRAEPRPG